MAKKSKGLGRGLDALFNEMGSEVEVETAPSSKKDNEGLVQSIKLDDIKPNANQPRKTFSAEKLEELANSIRENGMIQPIVLKPEGNGYIIVAGERRWRAAREAGLKEVPCIVRELDDRELALFAIIENMQREDLNPIEEAEGISSMAESFGMTQEQISKSVGKSRPYITNLLRLLKLPKEVQDMVNAGEISSGHARALLSLKSEEMMIKVAKKIVKESLSVRQTEELVKHDGKRRTPAARKIRKNPEIIRVEEDLKKVLGTKVNLKDSGKKGRIEIEYYSRDELQRLIELLESL